MLEEGLLRTLIAVGCRPGKEVRAAEELMDLLMYFDEDVYAFPLRKGLVLGVTKLDPSAVSKALEGKVSAYINSVVMGRRFCSCRRVMRKGCLLRVDEGREGICIGRVILKLEGYLKNKGGILKRAQCSSWAP